MDARLIERRPASGARRCRRAKKRGQAEEGGEEDRREVGVDPALGMQKHTVRQIGVSDGKHGTGFERPIILQNVRPRAPPAVW